MADALSRYRQAEPSKDALKRYRQEPSGDTLGALAKYLGLQGYWDRQGELAQGGLDMAEQGAQQFRDTLNPIGLAKMVGGPLAYIGSPVGALLPTEAETYAARDLPEWFKPGAAAGIGTMMAVMPGPKGARLGKGMGALAEGATDAERLALQARLEAEAAQTGGAPSMATRDQALGNLTEADLAEVARLRERMRMFEDVADVPVKQMTPEQLARLRSEAEAARAKNPPKKYEIPPMEDFLPKKPRK